MRADRLVATLLILQARGRITAAELAEELEVSLKTARRDLEALSIAGIPVYSQPGRNGGWQLLGGARTDLSGLTAAEARTLFLVAGPSSALSPQAKAALRKLVRALPETFRADAEAASAAVVLDPAHWGSHPAATPRHLVALQQAVIEGVQVRIGYVDRNRAETERTIHPLGLVAKSGVWYLVAETDRGQRTFRVGRIRALTVTDEPVVRPEGFDLTEAWNAIAADVDERRRAAQATVLVSPGDVYPLRGQFGTDVAVGETRADGRVEVTVWAGSIRMVAWSLAGWGHTVEVVDPPEVRAELARIGTELVAAYGSAPI